MTTELKNMIEWWGAGVEVEHIATYGPRIYLNDSMLLNHNDNIKTHI